MHIIPFLYCETVENCYKICTDSILYCDVINTYIHCCCVLSSCVSMCRYVSHPDGQPVTADYILNGLYQVEVMGRRYDTFVHLTGPFDPNGKRLEGNYDEPLPIRQ